MQEQHNRLESNKLQQMQQDKELVELVELSTALLESEVGKKWYKAVQSYYLVKQGTFHPGMTNADYWAAYREGQNSFIRQLSLWHHEKRLAEQMKVKEANDAAIQESA